jgi:hypothetical protein
MISVSFDVMILKKKWLNLGATGHRTISLTSLDVLFGRNATSARSVIDLGKLVHGHFSRPSDLPTPAVSACSGTNDLSFLR